MDVTTAEQARIAEGGRGCAVWHWSACRPTSAGMAEVARMTDPDKITEIKEPRSASPVMAKARMAISWEAPGPKAWRGGLHRRGKEFSLAGDYPVNKWNFTNALRL